MWEPATLWDHFAELHSKPEFRQRFLHELRALNRFQKDYPDHPTDRLVAVLEKKIQAVLNRTFSVGQIQRLQTESVCDSLQC